MKRPKLSAPKRAYGSHVARARTKKDAAVQLVVLEFGVSRLEREIAHTRERMTACLAELEAKTAHRRTLIKRLDP